MGLSLNFKVVVALTSRVAGGTSVLLASPTGATLPPVVVGLG